MILLLSAASATVQEPIYVEPIQGVPRVCVSFAPATGPFKKKDAKTWQKIRDAIQGDAYDKVPGLLGKLKKDHPAKHTVQLAIEVIAEQPASDPKVALEASPNDPCLHQTVALLGVVQGDQQLAVENAEAAFRLDPEQPDGLVLYYLMNPADAATGDRLEKAVEAHPKLTSLRLVAGRAALDQGDFRLAIEHFAAASEMGVDAVEEPLFHLRRMAGYLEDYLQQASTMQGLPLDLVDFSKAKDGVESYEAAYLRALGLQGDQQLVAHLSTNQGELSCTLHHRRAPVTVSNFVGLAMGEQAVEVEERQGKPFYDGLIFHRVIPGFMIQGGDPQGTGQGSPGYRFLDELEPTLGFDRPGVLAMANSGPGTNGSQFFVTEAAVPHLDGRHTIFGQCNEASVTVVERIARVETAERDQPVEDVVLEGVTFEVRDAPEKEKEP